MREGVGFALWTRRYLRGAAILCALAAAMFTGAMSQAAGYTESDVVRDIAYVPMKDGTRIAYISYRPKTGRYPTVFAYSPYNGNSTSFETAKAFLDAGYAYVGANFPGTGCSEGVIDHWVDGFDAKEGIYGAEVVEWIAKQSWSNGNVGMVGNSSLGTLQFWVASHRPPHLRALVASGVEDGYEYWLSPGGMLQIESTAGYVIHTENVTQARGADWRISRGDKECAAIRGSDRQALKYPFFDEVRKHPLKDAWWDAANLATKDIAGKVEVPTMLIAMEQDNYGGAARESARLFSQLMPNAKHKRLVLMNGHHGNGGPGGYSLADNERMRFLERWLKGVQNGIEDEPPVAVYWEVQEPDGDPHKSVAGWVTSYDAWPAREVERRPFYLTADAAISPDKPAASANEGARAYLYPIGAELVGGNQQFALAPNANGVLNYRTAPMTSDMTLLGNPEVTLYFSIDNGDDTDIALTLKDVDPAGNVLFLQSGLLRASLRAIDEAQSYADEVVPFYNKSEMLVPGKIYEIRLSLLSPIAHVVRQGHRLELTVAAPNPIPHPNIASIPAGAPSINRVYHSDKYPSRILLPIIPGATAQAPAPKCGTLRSQACRKETKFEPGGLPMR